MLDAKSDWVESRERLFIGGGDMTRVPYVYAYEVNA